MQTWTDIDYHLHVQWLLPVVTMPRNSQILWSSSWHKRYKTEAKAKHEKEIASIRSTLFGKDWLFSKNTLPLRFVENEFGWTIFEEIQFLCVFFSEYRRSKLTQGTKTNLFSCPGQLYTWHCRSVCLSQLTIRAYGALRLLRDFWETFERPLRAFWETFERLLRDFWETFERPLRDFWETFERLLRDFWETFERLLRDSDLDLG